MKINNYMRAIGILLILMVIGVCGYSQEALKSGLGLPSYRDTGNPSADAARYQNDKAAWVKAHPAEYQAYLKAIGKWEASSPGQGAYLNSPWKSQGEKDQMIASKGKEYQAQTSQFPSTKVKVDKRDFDRLDAKNKEMILANPNHYEVIVNLNPTK